MNVPAFLIIFKERFFYQSVPGTKHLFSKRRFMSFENKYRYEIVYKDGRNISQVLLTFRFFL